MTIDTLEIAGIRPAVLSARLSYDSVGDGCGPKDMALLAGLADRSNSEGKALRMVMAWAAIRAPPGTGGVSSTPTAQGWRRGRNRRCTPSCAARQPADDYRRGGPPHH